MAASYPATDFTWTNRVDNVDDIMAADTNTLAAEIDAIETDLVGSGSSGGLKASAASFKANWLAEHNTNGTHQTALYGFVPIGALIPMALSMTGSYSHAQMLAMGCARCDGTTPASQGISAPTIADIMPNINAGAFIRGNSGSWTTGVASGGADSVTLTTSELPAHTHTGTTATGGVAHTHSGITDNKNLAHTHSGTSDNTNLAHTHSGTTATTSVAHTHSGTSSSTNLAHVHAGASHTHTTGDHVHTISAMSGGGHWHEYTGSAPAVLYGNYSWNSGANRLLMNSDQWADIYVNDATKPASTGAHTHTGTTDNPSGTPNTGAGGTANSGAMSANADHTHTLTTGAMSASDPHSHTFTSGAMSTGADHTHTFTSGAMSGNADHTHTFTSGAATATDHTHTFTTASNGSGSSFSILPIYFNVVYYMRVK